MGGRKRTWEAISFEVVMTAIARLAQLELGAAGDDLLLVIEVVDEHLPQRLVPVEATLLQPGQHLRHGDLGHPGVLADLGPGEHLAAEQEVERFGRSDMSTVSLRLANVYGPRPDNTQFLTEDAPLLGSGIGQERNPDGSASKGHPAFKPHPMQGWTPDFIPKLTGDAVDMKLFDRVLTIAGPDAIRASASALAPTRRPEETAGGRGSNGTALNGGPRVMNTVPELPTITEISGVIAKDRFIRSLGNGSVPGEVLMLENTRFDPREEANDEGMARELARLHEIMP